MREVVWCLESTFDLRYLVVGFSDVMIHRGFNPVNMVALRRRSSFRDSKV